MRSSVRERSTNVSPFPSGATSPPSDVGMPAASSVRRPSVVHDAARRVADLQVDGMIGHRGRQLRARRQALLRELPRREPADRCHPLAGLGFLRGLGERGLQVRDRGRGLEAHDERSRRLRGAHEMRVVVDQARDHRAPAEIDDPDARLLAIDGRAHGQESMVANANRAHGPVRGVHRQNRAVRQHQIRAAGTSVRGAARRAQRQAEAHDADDDRAARNAAAP